MKTTAQPLWQRFDAWAFPPPPANIRAELERRQFDLLRRQVPLLHAVAIFSMALVIWLAIDDGAPLPVIGILTLLPLFNVWRIIVWRRRLPAREPAQSRSDVSAQLRGASLAVVAGLAAASGISLYTFLAGTFSEPAIIPVSLTYGTLCVAHSIAPLRRTASLALVAGIVPTSLLMLTSADLMTRMIAVSGITVTLLLLRFIGDQFAQMVASITLEERVRRQAMHDPLTGLLNRRGFEDALGRFGARQAITLVLVDLDGFKAVNDRHGHAVGDRYLELVAQRLRAPLDDAGLAARLGGDEFILAVPAPDEGALARALIAALCRPVVIGSTRLNMTASFGMAAMPADASNLQDVIAAADAALYRAKAAGKCRVMRHGRPGPLATWLAAA